MSTEMQDQAVSRDHMASTFDVQTDFVSLKQHVVVFLPENDTFKMISYDS